MKIIEAFMVLNLFVGVTGFGFGAAESTLKLREEVDITKSVAMFAMGLISMVLNLIYAYKWFTLTPSGFFVGLLPVGAWIGMRAFGNSWINGSVGDFVPWRIPVIAAAVAILSYELFAEKFLGPILSVYEVI